MLPDYYFKNLPQEPDEEQIEVAIEAMKNVLVEDREADKW